jgi:hypothetical protein
MEAFHKIILFSAILLLFISLLLIGIALTYSTNKSWPPNTPICPDYWLADGSGNNTTCTNMKDLGTCPALSGDKHLKMNFNLPAFTGSQGLCNKYKWANNCDISWDAVTYGINNPCQG